MCFTRLLFQVDPWDAVTNTSGLPSPTGSVTFTVTGAAITFTTSALMVGGNTVTASRRRAATGSASGGTGTAGREMSGDQ